MNSEFAGSLLALTLHYDPYERRKNFYWKDREPLTIIAKSNTLSALERFSLGSRGCTPEGIERLGESLLGQLSHLGLLYGHWSGEKLRALFKGASFEALRSLDLSYTETPIELLDLLPETPRLEALAISVDTESYGHACGVKRSCFKEFCQHPKLSEVRTLRLSTWDFNSAGYYRGPQSWDAPGILPLSQASFSKGLLRLVVDTWGQVPAVSELIPKLPQIRRLELRPLSHFPATYTSDPPPKVAQLLTGLLRDTPSKLDCVVLDLGIETAEQQALEALAKERLSAPELTPVQEDLRGFLIEHGLFEAPVAESSMLPQVMEDKVIDLAKVDDAWLEREAGEPRWISASSVCFEGEAQRTSGASWASFLGSKHLKNVRSLALGSAARMLTEDVVEVLHEPDTLPVLERFEIKQQEHRFGTKSLNYSTPDRGEGLSSALLPAVAAVENGLIKETRPALRALLRWENMMKRGLTSQVAEAALDSPYWDEVQTLVCGGEFEGDGGPILLERLGAIDSLRRLVFARSCGHDFSVMELLRAAVAMRSIQSLELRCRHSNLESALIEFAQKGAMRLEHFRSDSEVSEAAMSAMVNSPVFQGVEEVELNNLGWLFHIDVFTAARLKAVKVLRMQDIRLLPRAMEALMQSALCGNLRVLDLSNNRELGDDGAKAIAQCKALKSLETLELKRCGIKKAGAKALANSKYLSESIRAPWVKKAR